MTVAMRACVLTLSSRPKATSRSHSRSRQPDRSGGFTQLEPVEVTLIHRAHSGTDSASSKTSAKRDMRLATTWLGGSVKGLFGNILQGP